MLLVLCKSELFICGFWQFLNSLSAGIVGRPLFHLFSRVSSNTPAYREYCDVIGDNAFEIHLCLDHHSDAYGSCVVWFSVFRNLSD